MRHIARRHPIATALVVLILSPYIVAALLVLAMTYGLALILDTLGIDL